MAELKGKYAPYFDLIVDSSRNKKTLKCKLCSGGSTLAYHGNTSVMKSHLEAKHVAEYRKMLGETSGSGQLKEVLSSNQHSNSLWDNQECP